MRWLFLGLCLLLVAACAPAPQRDAPAPTTILTAEAAPAGWDSTAPPATGWTRVALPDGWDARWPRHDGVVWYRIQWRQTAAQPTGLLIDYASLASAIFVNGSLVARDASLAEPLSRSWTRPRHFLLDAPLLRVGDNSLLVRVSGLAAYQPGFGTVTVGDPAMVKAEFAHRQFMRFDIKLVTIALNGALGAFFLMIWLLRRRETVFGWFALAQFATLVFNWNFLAQSPGPFATTHGWQAMNVVANLGMSICYAIFLFRFGERRYRRIEALMGAAWLGLALLAMAAPAWIGANRAPCYLASGVIYYASIAWLAARAIDCRRLDYNVLLACQLVPVLASLHDYGLLFGWIRGSDYIFGIATIFMLAASGFVIAHRLVTATRRIEGFNAELRDEIDAATVALSDTLAREHRLELAHARDEERLQLVRDLHDGFGGTLVGAITRLEQAPQDMPDGHLAAILREMRDDLRLVIDTTTREQDDLVGLLAPFRHRSGLLLETTGIDSRWHLEGLDGILLDSAASLDLLRLLQEALTNVLKHSQATRVDVRIARIGGRIGVEVRDNGRGFVAGASSASGAGLASMLRRATRLGGLLEISADTGGTTLRFDLPAPDASKA
ncbi:MAG: sensor histidine kinase [Sphingobium sp.]